MPSLCVIALLTQVTPLQSKSIWFKDFGYETKEAQAGLGRERANWFFFLRDVSAAWLCTSAPSETQPRVLGAASAVPVLRYGARVPGRLLSHAGVSLGSVGAV